MVRSIYRVAEYVQGRGGYLQSKELFLYLFDAVLMVATMAIIGVVHPSEINTWLKEGRGTEAVTRLEMQNLSRGERRLSKGH